MNNYEDKQARRRARLEAAAARAGEESKHRLNRAHESIAGIPPGQPILVDHYSARRHLAALARHDRSMRAAIDADERSRELAARAAAVGTGGISADDPEAVAKLRVELERLKSRQSRMRAINDAHRRFLQDPQSLVEASLSEEDKALVRAFKATYRWIPHPHSPAQLQNNSANVRRIEKRIQSLEKQAARADQAPEVITCAGYTVTRNYAINRLQIRFPGVPNEAVRKLLKSNGYRWSPREAAWQRMLNAGAEYMLTQGHLRSQVEAHLAAAKQA